MIHYQDIELLALVDADIPHMPPMFNDHLLLGFTEQHKSDLFANTNIGSVFDLICQLVLGQHPETCGPRVRRR